MQVEELDADWRLAYVGRLIRSLAICYGLSTEDADGRSPGALLRGLNNIVDMRLMPGPAERTKGLGEGQARDRRRGNS